MDGAFSSIPFTSVPFTSLIVCFSNKENHMPDTEDSIQLLFPTVLQISDLSNEPEMNANLTSMVEEIRRRHGNSKPQSWACDLYTTIGEPEALFHWQELRPFCEIVLTKIRQFGSKFAYDVSQAEINECWVNVYESGHAQEIHLHKNSVVSGIYYLKVPEGSGPTMFYSPQSDVMLEPRPGAGNQYNATVSAVPPVEGRLVVFKSSLRHAVMPGLFEGDRITLAFNAMI